jgi:hypothetical protein
VEDPDLLAAVKATKRSPIYRERRALLHGVRPTDAWIEPEHHMAIVIFETAPPGEAAFQGFFAFRVQLETREVQDVSLLSLARADEGWRVVNAGSGA